MAVNKNDKYYTPQWLVKKVVSTMLIVLSGITITELVEPSAGDGAFINELEILKIPTTYYDLYPEHDGIKQQDFLKLDLPQMEGRVVIGNPPFGGQINLFKQFVRKSNAIADYTVFISPISQYNNQQQLNNCNLIYSEDLGDVEYLGENLVKVKSCLNIYKSGEHTPDDRYKEIRKDVEIRRGVSKTNKHKKFPMNGHYWDKDIKTIECDMFLSHFGQPLHLTSNKNELFKCGYIIVRVLDDAKRSYFNTFFKNFEKTYMREIKEKSTSAPSVTVSFIYEKLHEQYTMMGWL